MSKMDFFSVYLDILRSLTKFYKENTFFYDMCKKDMFHKQAIIRTLQTNNTHASFIIF
jgi:hypothetical protein